MAEYCILLTGAPDRDTLSLDERQLLDTFCSPVKRFLGGEYRRISLSSQSPSPSLPAAKWRTLPGNDSEGLRNDVFESDFDQTHFLSFEDLPNQDQDADRLNFLEHSFAALDGLGSSQIAPTAEADDGAEMTFESAISEDTSFAETSFETSDSPIFSGSLSELQASQGEVKLLGSMTDLRRIPNADHINRIQPQTITVNLMVGVISLSPPRTVRLRRRDAKRDIVELLVGDHTRAGFSISFWLSPTDSQHKPIDDLREHLNSLRNGDILLLQNIALSCFKGCVYGQSLSKRFAKNSTSIHRLTDDNHSGWPPHMLSKLTTVCEWTNNFVGVSMKRPAPPTSGDSKPLKKRRGDDVPPDTQD